MSTHTLSLVVLAGLLNTASDSGRCPRRTASPRRQVPRRRPGTHTGELN